MGAALRISGQHWPAGQSVLITLSHGTDKNKMQVNPNAAIGKTAVGKDGRFEARVAIPAGQGWEDAGDILIVVFTEDANYAATTPFKVVVQYKPTLGLEPQTAAIGEQVALTGDNWPPRSQVRVAVIRANQPVNIRALGPGWATTQVGDDRHFQIGIALPPGQGWEQETQARVVAYTADFRYSAAAPLGIQAPQPTAMPEKPPPPPEQPTVAPQPTEAPPTAAPTKAKSAPPKPTPSKPNQKATTVPAQARHAVLAVSPMSGTVGITITVQGQGWPAGRQVNLTVSLPVPQGAPPAPVNWSDRASLSTHRVSSSTPSSSRPGSGWRMRRKS